MSCRNIAALLNQEGVPTPATYANLPVARPGPYTGLWSSERISDMLQNETYIGNMVQGRSVKISYKSKKCLKQHSGQLGGGGGHPRASGGQGDLPQGAPAGQQPQAHPEPDL